MFVTKIKTVLAVVLVVGLALSGAPGLLYQTQAADQPEAKGGGLPVAKKDQKDQKGRPMTKEEPAPKNAKQEQKVLTPEEAIKQRPKEAVTVQFKVASVEAMPNPCGGFGGPNYYIFLHDGGKFTARLARAADQFMKLGIEPVKHFNGKVVRVTGRIAPDARNSSFRMWVRDLADIEVVGLALGGIGVGVGLPTNPVAVAQEKTGDQALDGLWEDIENKGAWLRFGGSTIKFPPAGESDEKVIKWTCRYNLTLTPMTIDIFPKGGTAHGIFVFERGTRFIALGQKGY
jgi:hypothetical protein